MYFKTITIENLFSYYGITTFSLLPPDHNGKNIVIIRGRNGQGKTSFLNSIKILFGGISDDLTKKVSSG
ncbi:MAG: AAA family ATPase, partial [Candidatus Omnitrophica bacterium]|nr:AAA family ATPase [Candidatus Omnitrophota bacterium]